jgi:hypothetical protein
VTDASTPSGDSATSPGPAAAIAPDVRADPMAGARAAIPDAIDLDTIEADLDRVESALQQLADGTYWDRVDAPVDAVSVDAPVNAVSASEGTSTSAPAASV